MEITEETLAYMNGTGTREQQELFQRAADRIDEIYREQNPIDPDSESPAEDEQTMVAEQLVGAVEYALGDADLHALGMEVKGAWNRLFTALDRLAGAMVAAEASGLTVTEIARQAGVTRATVYKRLGR